MQKYRPDQLYISKIWIMQLYHSLLHDRNAPPFSLPLLLTFFLSIYPSIPVHLLNTFKIFQPSRVSAFFSFGLLRASCGVCTCAGAGAPWIPSVPPGHWDPHQPHGVQSQLLGLYDTHTRGAHTHGQRFWRSLHLIKAPKEPIGGYEYDEKFLKQMHYLLLEVGVSEGTLQCSESGCLFPVSRRIPNMLLSDEETET